MAVKLPLVTQDVFQQGLAAAAGLAVRAVVSTHDGLDAGLFDQCAERGQVGLPQILLGDDRIEVMAVALGAGVNGEVLGAGGGLQVIGVIALHTLDEADAETACQERVLAVSFVAASPAGIAEDVDVGSPDGQALEDVAVAVGAAHIIFAAGLNADGVADLLHHVLVKGGGHADRLGEHGSGACAAYAVDALAPPVVSRDAQTLDGGGPAQHLADLLVQGHLRDKVGSTLAVLSLFSGILGSLHNALCFLLFFCALYRTPKPKMVNTLSVQVSCILIWMWCFCTVSSLKIMAAWQCVQPACRGS